MEKFECPEVKIYMKRVQREARDVILHVERGNYDDMEQIDKIYQGLSMVLAGLSSLYAYGAYRHYVGDFVSHVIKNLYGTVH